MQGDVEQLIRLNQELHDLFNENDNVRFHCTNIGRMECSLLQYLYKHREPVCMNDLSCELGVSHSRITRIVDNLVKKKLVNRYPSNNDRRRWFTEITEKGIATARSAEQENEEFQARILSHLPGKHIDTVMQYLETYIDAFKKSLEERSQT